MKNIEKRSFEEFYRVNIANGCITMEKHHRTGKSGPILFDSTEIQMNDGLKRVYDVQKARNELTENNNIRVAIAHIDTRMNFNGIPNANHWMLIVKDENNIWMNSDHSRFDGWTRKGKVDWRTITELIY